MIATAVSLRPPARRGEQLRLDLSAAERAEVGALVRRLVRVPPGLVDDPAWLAAARRLSCRLPVRMREALRAFRHDPGRDGVLLVRGLPVDPSTVPPTPAVHGSVQREATGPAAVVTLAGLGLGEIVSFRDEKSGALVQDVLPVPGFEPSQSNAGSVPLQLHVENAFHDHRPDYVGLLCLRADHDGRAGTLVASVRRALPHLSDADRYVLSQDRFVTAAPPSFQGAALTPPHPVLGGTPDDPDVRFDVQATRALDREAGEVLERLAEVMHECAVDLVLRPGDLAVLDNRIVMHGRAGFTPRYDGHDRWLHRVYVSLDNRRNRPARPGNGAVLR